MNTYAIFNFFLAAFVLPVSYFLTDKQCRWKDLRLSARVAVLLTLIAYPWDFFAINMQVWRHPVDPGPTLYGVPINDLIFIWICTHLTSTVLIAIDRREPNAEADKTPVTTEASRLDCSK